jgi:hypothetical protein
VVEGLSKGLSDEVHVLYVSPLKALSNDDTSAIERNRMRKSPRDYCVAGSDGASGGGSGSGTRFFTAGMD